MKLESTKAPARRVLNAPLSNDTEDIEAIFRIKGVITEPKFNIPDAYVLLPLPQAPCSSLSYTNFHIKPFLRPFPKLFDHQITMTGFDTPYFKTLINALHTLDSSFQENFRTSPYERWIPVKTDSYDGIKLQTRLCRKPDPNTDEEPPPVLPAGFDPKGFLLDTLINHHMTIDPLDIIELAKLKDGNMLLAEPSDFNKGDIVEADFAICIVPRGKDASRKSHMKLVLRRMTQLKRREDYVRSLPHTPDNTLIPSLSKQFGPPRYDPRTSNLKRKIRSHGGYDLKRARMDLE